MALSWLKCFCDFYWLNTIDLIVINNNLSLCLTLGQSPPTKFHHNSRWFVSFKTFYHQACRLFHLEKDGPFGILKYNRLPSYSIVHAGGQFLFAGYIIEADLGVRQRAQGIFCSWALLGNMPLSSDWYSAPDMTVVPRRFVSYALYSGCSGRHW